MELLLIRHALPQRVEGDGTGGPADPRLADLGHRQAKALAGWLAGEGVDAVWTSPLRRAMETATPTAEQLGLPVTVDDGLAEYDKDAASYIPIEELKAAGDTRWMEVPEDAETFRATVVAAVERIVAAHAGQRVAVVCHGGVVNAYASHVLGLAGPLFFLPTYCSISRVVASSRGHRTVGSLNETAHVRDLL